MSEINKIFFPLNTAIDEMRMFEITKAGFDCIVSTFNIDSIGNCFVKINLQGNVNMEYHSAERTTISFSSNSIYGELRDFMISRRDWVMFDANVLSLQPLGNSYKDDEYFTYQDLNNGLFKLTKASNNN